MPRRMRVAGPGPGQREGAVVVDRVVMQLVQLDDVAVGVPAVEAQLEVVMQLPVLTPSVYCGVGGSSVVACRVVAVLFCS